MKARGLWTTEGEGTQKAHSRTQEAQNNRAWNPLVVLFVSFLCFLCSGFIPPALAQASRPSILQEVGIDQELGSNIDLNLQFRDETGTTIPLSTYFHNKPVVLVPVYFTCSTLCPLTLN